MYRFHPYAISFAIAFVVAVCNLLAEEENAPVLSYGFVADRQYAFEVKIQTEMEKYDELREGVLTYTVSSAKDTQFVLKPSGNLLAHIKFHPDEHVTSRVFPPTSPFRWRGAPEGITFNRQGAKIVSRELTPLPYLLGDMELLVIEEFQADAKSNWEKGRDVEVVERDAGSPFPRFMFASRFDSGTHTSAKEQITYAVLKSDKDSVEISKKYSLRSVQEADKPIRFEMTGEGQFTFDLTEGVIKSLSMKYECRENEKNLIRKFPITLTYHLLSAEELAEHKKKAEEAQAAAAKAREPKDFEPGERERLLKDLKSSDPKQLRDAADRLAKVPLDDHPADISKALALLLRHSDNWVAKSAAEALVVWATPEAESALIKTSQSDDVFLRNSSIKALGKLKTAKAAEAVAAQLLQQNSRHEASEALKAMGPVAEDATIPLLNDREMWVRREACLILREIGGKKSLTDLQKFVQKASFSEDREAKNAISAIEIRLATAADEDGGTETIESKSKDSAGPSPFESSAELRMWRDTTGTFSVEAFMLSLEDGQVVLQKKDGKTIRVLITKLSPADKKFVLEHTDNAKSKPENPFE